VETFQPGAGADKDEGRIERGWRLTQVAWKLVREDRTLLALALAGLVCTMIFASLVFVFSGYFGDAHQSRARVALLSTIAFFPTILVGVFFNVALASAASAAFDGEHMTAGEALRAAWGKRGRIALWALISAVVGTLIAEVASRIPGGGRLVAWLGGAAWGLATIFVIPILAIEGVGAADSLKRSAKLVRKRWGEGVTGYVSIGAWSVIAFIPLGILVAIGLGSAGRHPGAGVPMLVAAMVGVTALMAVVSATNQVFAVALYRHAIGAPVGGFSSADLEYPFNPDPARRKRKSWILRIGGGFLVAFAVLGAIVAIVGPGRHTAAEGYFHYYWTIGNAPAFSQGDPVTYHARRIGEVSDVEVEGAQLRVSIHVDPAFRYAVETHGAFAIGGPADPSLCVGTHGECGPPQGAGAA
jgi:hypothetical protein